MDRGCAARLRGLCSAGRMNAGYSGTLRLNGLCFIWTAQTMDWLCWERIDALTGNSGTEQKNVIKSGQSWWTDIHRRLRPLLLRVIYIYRRQPVGSAVAGCRFTLYVASLSTHRVHIWFYLFMVICLIAWLVRCCVNCSNTKQGWTVLNVPAWTDGEIRLQK